MTIAAISDTHGHHRKVTLPESDIILFAGDAMTCGYKEYELMDFLDWLHGQPAKHKVMIAGNHDRYIENNNGLFQDLLKNYPSITYLENSGTYINGLSIWGTPDSKEFCGWAFNRTDEQMKKSFGLISEDADILLSHAPQYGVLDMLERGERVGEKTLRDQIAGHEFMRYHIFGHIHCQYGKVKLPTHTAINVSAVNEQYVLTNNPVVFKIYPHG